MTKPAHHNHQMTFGLPESARREEDLLVVGESVSRISVGEGQGRGKPGVHIQHLIRMGRGGPLPANNGLT